LAFDLGAFNREVGLYLQVNRKRTGMTQEDVALALGIARASYANIEAGRQRISIDVLWKAAVLFSVSVDALVPPRKVAGQAEREWHAKTPPVSSVTNQYVLVKQP